MIEIKDLLIKFSNLLISEEIKKALVADTISSVIGIQIKTEDVKIKKGTVYLNIKPIYKNEVFLRQDEISEKLSVALGKNYPKEIR
jgi:hypothetical protein